MKAVVVGQLGFLVLNSILSQLSEATCPDSKKKWANKAVYEAAEVGLPNYTLAKIGDGFSRTLNLDGFCNNIVWNFIKFEPVVRTNEWHAKVKQQMGVFAKFDNGECELQGVTVARTAPDKVMRAELRMEFGDCKKRAGATTPDPLASFGSVAIGLQSGSVFPGTGAHPNLLAWMQAVNCQEGSPFKTNTYCEKDKKSAEIKMKNKITLTEVKSGNKDGFCDADVIENGWVNLPTASHKDGCKAACAAAHTKAKALGNKTLECHSFSFNPGTDKIFDSQPQKLGQPPTRCALHNKEAKGVITHRRLGGNSQLEQRPEQQRQLAQGSTSTKKATTTPKTTTKTTTTINWQKQPDWVCYNMDVGGSQLNQKVVTTTMPPGPLLHVKEVMGGSKESMKEAILYQVDPASCPLKTWWFELQNEFGQPGHITISEDNWNQIMNMVPKYESDASHANAINSSITIDRVLVKTCSNITGWGRTCTAVKSRHTCDTAQVINGVVTGCATPLLGWLLVYWVYQRLKQMDSSAQVVQGPEDAKSPICTTMIVVVCCMASLVVAMGISYGVSTLLQKILSPNCLHGHREQSVVFLTCGGATSLTMIIGIVYLYQSRGKPEAARQGKPQLALAEVAPDGTHIIHNHDIMSSGQMIPSPSRPLPIKHDETSMLSMKN